MQKGLPNRFYTTREDFLLEREMIFSSMWTCIGFASDTAEPGDAFPLEFMELPLLILRGEDHQLRVFHNVCPHRGHILGYVLYADKHYEKHAVDGPLPAESVREVP